LIKGYRINFSGFAVSAIFGCIAVGSITYVCFRFHLNLTITSFLYLIVVVLQSLHGNFASSAFISLLTVACLDFFFTQPLFSFEVTNPLDILALISCLSLGWSSRD
jgi:K+-sensing histidine kinase KdpD